jgi:hypothetical protein
MHFWVKNILKNNHNHILKHTKKKIEKKLTLHG